MNSAEAIEGSLKLAEVVAMTYLADLSDEDLLQRPHPDCNQVNWQVGHLIQSEHDLMSRIAPAAMPTLPPGFSETYTKQHVAATACGQFASKDELLEAYKEQREATLKILSRCSEADLDTPTGIDYAPTKGALIAMQGSHWLMHCGQWVILRRMLGKPVVI